MDSKLTQKILKKASKMLDKVLTAADVPESHGLSHAQKVVENLQNAIESNNQSSDGIQISPERELALHLGALLHDADDKKYFPENKSYENAKKILKKVLKSQTGFELDTKIVIKETLETITYVSASDNGNSVPERAQLHPELLWVRYSDRLEAIGTIGAVRCWQYNTEKGSEHSVETTPRPKTKEEVWANVTPDRLDNYMRTKTSDSMMDHYYDKLLQIAVFDKETVSNVWLCEEADRRVDPLVKVCLKFGKTGKAPISMIKKFAKELEQPKEKDQDEKAASSENENVVKDSVDEEESKEPAALGKRKRQDSTQDELTKDINSKRRRTSDSMTGNATCDQQTQTKEPKKTYERTPIQGENYYKTTRRGFTSTLVVPSSIVDNAQSLELKTYLVSQIAKAAATFCFNEIVIVSCDKHNRMSTMKQEVTTTEFFVQNLEYVETPQYLRKALFPKTPALRFAGLMNPIDTPNHVRADEWTPYREGVIINRPSKDGKGSWANIGIYKDCQLDMSLQEGTRVTVKLDQSGFSEKIKYYSGKVVSQEEPFLEYSTYWGYRVRVANSLEDVFKECPYEGGYDFKLGTSDKGNIIDFEDFKQWKGFKHGMIFFGGLEGIEGLVEMEEESELKPSDVHKLFDMYLNTCPEQGVRTIRTEEAILLSMAAILPRMRAIGHNSNEVSAHIDTGKRIIF